MVETIEPREITPAEEAPPADGLSPVEEVSPAEVRAVIADLAEPGLVAGRPVEDRSFEVVEAGAGLMAGMVVGTAVAGPIGTAVGGLLGAAAGFAAGEVLERHEGRAATTTDAAEPEPVTPR